MAAIRVYCYSKCGIRGERPFMAGKGIAWAGFNAQTWLARLS